LSGGDGKNNLAFVPFPNTITKMRFFTAGLLLLLGFGGTYLIINGWNENRSLQQRAKRAEARIINIEQFLETIKTGKRGSKQVKRFLAVLEFDGINFGKEKNPCIGVDDKSRVGDVVSIVYDPVNPSKVRYPFASDHFIILGVLGFFSFCVGLFGVVMLLAGKTAQTQE